MTKSEGERRRTRRRSRWPITLVLIAVGVVVGWLALTGFARSTRLTFDAALPDDGVFGAGSVEPDEMSRYRAAADYSAAHGGQALLVLKGETVVFEEYQDGWTADRPHHLFSGTKSFCCALAAAAMADGKLALDERAADTLVEWRGDPRRERITVRQLLDLSSGLKNDFRHLTLDGLKKIAHQQIHDKYRHALEQPCAREPGQRFSYGTVHYSAFGELIERKLGEAPLAYLERRVLRPIGFRYAGWNTDPAGNPQLAYGAWTTARHWARYGVLLRDEGRWRGEQVLPAEHLALCRQPSPALPAYGLTLWLNREIPAKSAASLPERMLRGRFGGRRFDAEGSDDLFVAAGAKDQRLYVLPSKDLVIVRFGNGSGSFSDQQLLGLLLRGRLPG
jgi:CubicO group peptidase (beta-lactamase class C family)